MARFRASNDYHKKSRDYSSKGTKQKATAVAVAFCGIKHKCLSPVYLRTGYHHPSRHPDPACSSAVVAEAVVPAAVAELPVVAALAAVA